MRSQKDRKKKMGQVVSNVWKYNEKLVQFSLVVITYPILFALAQVIPEKYLPILRYVIKGPTTQSFTSSTSSE